jgi:hypothetical protein
MNILIPLLKAFVGNGEDVIHDTVCYVHQIFYLNQLIVTWWFSCGDLSLQRDLDNGVFW